MGFRLSLLAALGCLCAQEAAGFQTAMPLRSNSPPSSAFSAVSRGSRSAKSGTVSLRSVAGVDPSAMLLLSDASATDALQYSASLLTAGGMGALAALAAQGKIGGGSGAFVSSPPATAQEQVYALAQKNFQAWNSALQSGDPERVAALYSATDLSFLPTVSPQFVRDAPSTKNYFVEFVKKMPAGTITGDHVQVFGDDSYLHTGLYTFMTGPENARTPVQARFSYMWRKVDGAWKIVHHHSSALPGGGAPSAPPAEDMYSIAQENFHRWNDALKTKDPDQVAALYSTSELSFLPTVSGNFIRDTTSTREYFVEFIKKTPQGQITADDVQAMGNDAYLHTGMYTFMVGPEDARTPVQARFSYMWRRFDGEWKIVHHHSSVVPGQAAAPAPAPEVDLYPVARANFDRWNNALKTKDYEKVASLYCTQSLSFLPTVSPKFIRESADTKAYFLEFLKKLPEGTITSDDVQSTGPDSYLHSGLYTFMTGPEGARTPVEARFSYMWRKVDGEWKITHHHSSALPAAPSAPAPAAANNVVPSTFSIDTNRDKVLVSVEENK